MRPLHVVSALTLSLTLAACGSQAPTQTAVPAQELQVQVNTPAENNVIESRIMVILDNSALEAQSVDENGVIQLSAQAVENFSALASSVAAAHNLKLLRAVAPVSGLAILEVPQGVSAQGALRSLNLDPRVSAAGFDHWDFA